MEYLHYRQFFVTWEMAERAVDRQSSLMPVF